MLPLKASHKEQCYVSRFLWQKDLAQMPFILTYDEQVFTRATMHLWCMQFARGRCITDEEEPGCCVVSATNAKIAAADSLT